MSIERVPCDLCGEPVVWVQIQGDRRVALDPEPASFPHGKYSRVHPSLANGREDEVALVPENQRWMKARLYRRHNETCEGWHQCKRDGLDFATCLQRAKITRQQMHYPRGMTQSAREQLAPPGEYSLNRKL